MLSGKTKGYVELPLGYFYIVRCHDLSSEESCRFHIGGFNQKELQVLLTVLYRLLYSSDVYV